MPPATVHRYNDRGAGGFANLSLSSGERVFLSVAPAGLRVHRLVLWGRIPGKTLYTADAATLTRLVAVLERDIAGLPKLPDKAALDAFLSIATRALTDPSVYAGNPTDEEGETTTRLAVLTRAALAEPDAASLVRRFRRAAATP